MPLPRAITGGALLSLGGRRWWLRITHGVLLACEEATGLDMLTAGAELERPSVRLLRALLWAALQGAGAPWSEEDVGRQLPSLGAMHRAHLVVLEAWASSMPPAEQARADVAEFGPRKALTWLEAWALAHEDLRLASDEWRDMTPRQLHALRRAHLARLQREELLVGIVAATAANFGYRAPKRAMRAESFMLHPFEREEETGPVTGEMVMAALAPIKAELLAG
jgi:hypothetical protein